MPTIRRRLLVMVYEALLLLGVGFVAEAIFLVFAKIELIKKIPHVNEIWLFIVFGIYFVFFWQRGGQTLAMKTWRIKLVDNERAFLPLPKAIVRYLLAWLWLLPGVIIGWQFHLREWNFLIPIFSCFSLWALTPFLDKDRQFLHDRLAKTRLIQIELPPTASEA